MTAAVSAEDVKSVNAALNSLNKSCSLFCERSISVGVSYKYASQSNVDESNNNISDSSSLFPGRFCLPMTDDGDVDGDGVKIDENSLIDWWLNGETVRVSGEAVGERKLLGIRTYERSRVVVWQCKGDWLFEDRQGRIGSIQESLLWFSWVERFEWRTRLAWGDSRSDEGLIFFNSEDNFQKPPLPVPDSFFVRGTLIKDLLRDKLYRMEFYQNEDRFSRRRRKKILPAKLVPFF